jgi:subtilase family serine protease
MKRKVLFSKYTPINGGNGYYPEDIRRLYNVPPEYDGTGQTIGILEFSNGYSIRDAEQFWRMHNIPVPRVEFVSVDGTRNDGGISPDDEEASLDLQWAGAIAPKATLVVYEANAGDTYASFGQALIRTLDYILHDTTYRPSVLSISYGDAEDNFDENILNQIANVIQALDDKGVTVCIASGDQGAYGMHDLNRSRQPHADAPASVPRAIAVGGTTLFADGRETAWTYLGPEHGGATGGGFSRVFATPDYQGSLRAAGRGIPDIAFNADPVTGYQIVFHGQNAVVGGTSVSCPVFAGIVALANQARSMHGLPPLKNLVRTLYEESERLPYRDITVGNNSFNGVKGYEAAPGWDACTGWGSLDVARFIAALTPPNAAAMNDGLMPTVQGIVVRVKAVIASVEPDVVQSGVHHHHLIVSNIQVEHIEGADASVVQPEAFVAIRYGDKYGLQGPIPGLAAGQPIELQGQYVPINQTYPSVGNPGDPVIHFTHHPVGFVKYQGNLYE